MKIIELQLTTHNLVEQQAFYVEQMGFRLLDSTSDSITLEAGATRLIFREGEPACYHVAFNIPRNQFIEAKSWLMQRTALITWQENDQIHWKAWNAHAVYFLDAAGNIGEFIARHNLPDDAADPFSAASIRCVSEIGLVVENVAAAAKVLQSEFDLPIWDAGDGEVCRALGDEHGLFIIVRRGRPWFPTIDKMADFHPLRLTMRGESAKTYSFDDLPYRIEQR